jgi:hypothetical protein
MPYSSIKSIQYIRRYDWKTVLIGAAISALLLIQHFMFPIVSRTITSGITYYAIDLMPTASLELREVLANAWVGAILIALLIFLIRARTGFALHGATSNPIYLPRSFREAIDYIRSMQIGDRSD